MIYFEYEERYPGQGNWLPHSGPVQIEVSFAKSNIILPTETNLSSSIVPWFLIR